MLISIVTPHFNGNQYLTETGQSLIDQSHQDWEWIIVDDGSRQEELNLLDKWQEKDSRIRWQHRRGDSKGANQCRNEGWRSAAGKHVLFLDSDDMLLPHALQQRVNCMAHLSPETTDLLYFQTVAFRSEEPGQFLWDDPTHPTSWLASLWSQTPPCQSSGPFWTIAALKRAGGWTDDIQVWQDIDIHQRAHFKGVRFSPAENVKPDVLYRIHDESLSHSGFHSNQKLKSRNIVLLDALHHAQKNELEVHEYKSLAQMTWSVFRNACAVRNWAIAESIIEASQNTPEIPTRFLSHWKLHSLVRSQKLPFIRNRMEQQAEQLFSQGKRKILSIPYP